MTFRHPLLLCGLLFLSNAISALAAPPVVTELDVTNRGLEGSLTSLIDAHGVDGNPFSIRNVVTGEAEFTVDENRDYRARFQLIDAGGVVLGSSPWETFLGTTAGSTVIVPPMNIDTFSSRLDSYENHRLRLRIERWDLIAGEWIFAGTGTEATGRQYLHFDSTTSFDAALNVIPVAGDAFFGIRKWILDPMTDREYLLASIDFDLHRFDDWVASVPPVDDVTVEIEAQLRRTSDDGVIPLNDGGSTVNSKTFTQVISTEGWENLFLANMPTVTPSTFAGIRLDPAGQLDSTDTDGYYISVTLKHVETPGQAVVTGETRETDSHQIFHFNGNLSFGGIATQFTHLAAGPLVSVPATPVLEIPVDQQSGFIVGSPQHTFGDGSGLEVVLQANGDAVYNEPTSVVITQPAMDPAVVNHVTFERTFMSFTQEGLKGSIDVTLPAGCGFTSDLTDTILDSSFSAIAVPLGQGLAPTSIVTFTPSGSIFLHEETKPVLFETSSLTWEPLFGNFVLAGPVTPHSVRKPYLDALNTIPGLPSWQTNKKSNDAYWNHVDTVSSVIISASPTGAAQLTADDITLADAEFNAHFPYGTLIDWVTGCIDIDDDLLVPASSKLTGVSTATVGYATHCRDAIEGGCAGAAEDWLLYRVTPDSNEMNFTPHGGLHATGTTALGDKVEWGRLNGGVPSAHKAEDSFANANYLMAGHFFPASSAVVTLGIGPALVHLSGVDPTNLSGFHYPYDANYIAGTGDYAGVNLRVTGVDDGMEFTSRLGGSASDPYDLTLASKFYLRYSGVTGIQQAPTGLNAAQATLFGFPAQLDTFGLGWLSNDNVTSRTDGSVLVPQPTNITFDFDDLKFSCLGAPGPAKVQLGSEDLNLDYWDAPFRALGMDFVPGDPCNPAAGCIAVAARLSAQNAPAPLAGVLGFHHTGQILAPGSPLNDCGLRSEFPLPPVLRIRGPRQDAMEDPETYAFTASQPAYLNTESEDNRPPGPERVGFWNFIGTLDVPFFEDVWVHAHTSANPAEPTSALHMMGGFEHGGANLFSDPELDDIHAGRPTKSNQLSVTQYRASENNRPRARQEWLDVIEFDYPLVWNTTTRSFRSADAPAADLLVLEVDHRINYLSPGHADLSFGVEFTGIPRANLGRALFNELDENVGLAQNVVDAAGGEVFDAIEGATDSFSDLLSDQADRMLEEVVADLVDPGLDAFFDAAKDAAGDAIDTQDDAAAAVRAVVDSYLRAPLDPPLPGPPPPGPPPPTNLVPLSQTLSGFVGTLEAPSPAGLVPTIDIKLSGIETGVFGLVGDAGEIGNPLPSPGLFGRDQFGEVANVQALVEGMVGTFAAEYVSALANANLSGQIEKAEASFADIKASMDEIRESVSSLRDRLAAGQEFLSELNALQAQLDLLLVDLNPDSMLNSIADEVQDYLDRALDRMDENLTTRAEVDAYLDSLRDDIEARVKRAIINRLMASNAIDQMRQSIRDRTQVLHLAFRNTTDSAFEQVNDIIRESLSSAVAGLDETLNDFGQEINKTLKTGRVVGHAHIQDDAIRELSLDALIELGIPEDNPFLFDGFIRYQQMDSTGPGGCPDPSAPSPSRAVEITLGIRNADLEWFGTGLKADVSGQVGLLVEPVPIPISIGGDFEMKEGSLEIASAEVEDLRGTVKVGLAPASGGGLTLGENYLGLAGGVRLSGSNLEGGLFLGKSCDLEPILLLNPDLGNVLGEGGFAGAYVFGAGRIPIVDFGCAFNLSAGIGAGAFYSLPGPVWGGIMQCSARGEALCAISVKGEIQLIGVKDGDDFSFSGSGRVSGKAGVCPFCKHFSKLVRLTYRRGTWDADY